MIVITKVGDYMNIKEIALKVKSASVNLSALDGTVKNKALSYIAEDLLKYKEDIIEANKNDLDRSERENLSAPLLKRLKFDENKINEVIDGINSLIKLEDPVGKTLFSTKLDNDLTLYKVSCPIGVIGIIFESRPDALVQISTLCLKSGNAVLLKGGSEAMETNRILTEIIKNASLRAVIKDEWIYLLESRSDVRELLKIDDYVDLLIPRGSNEFVKYIMDNTRIPVLGHADGICHCYVDAEADLDLAIKVVTDSKTQYVSVCNSTETLLVHKDIAKAFLPEIKKSLEEKNVEIVGCQKTNEIIDVAQATEEDWKSEYLDYKISIKVVDSLEDAINHINTYGSGHTDSIITRNMSSAKKFMDLVDSGNVFLNCSTRFSDGFRYGFGAEVGISTNKIHARGPVGLDGLLIYKYKMIGNGNIVDDYSAKRKFFLHERGNDVCPL